MNKWQQYEVEKRKLQEEKLPEKEYERRIQELTERLGL